MADIVGTVFQNALSIVFEFNECSKFTKNA